MSLLKALFLFFVAAATAAPTSINVTQIIPLIQNATATPNNVTNVTTLEPTNQGQWGATLEFPMVAVAAALLPLSGNILIWSAYNDSVYQIGRAGRTQTAILDTKTGTTTQYTVANTGHDMFCPGLSMDFDGRPIVAGGDTAARVSIYNETENEWAGAADMLISRGYQAHTTLFDGSIFTIGGSWSGGLGGKTGEIYHPKFNIWQSLPNTSVDAMLTDDAQGIFRSDNHAWLFSWKAGFVLQAGPSKQMNWYHSGINGTTYPAGIRGNDDHAMAGNAVMYDAVAGKILTLGGAPDYQNGSATANAHIITIAKTPVVENINSMSFARVFANSVALPDGSVFITGGQTYSAPFLDDNATMIPELWNPTSQKFTNMAPNPTPRNYHSVGLLMPDGSVFTAGGGLCGNCTTNHFDGQFYYPPYLFEADGVTKFSRPSIVSQRAPTVEVGDQFWVETDRPVTSFAWMRVSATTHAINTDQRRVPLLPTAVEGLNYTMHLPQDMGVMIPGYWMLFAIDSNGVPSVAETIKVTPYHLPSGFNESSIDALLDQFGLLNG